MSNACALPRSVSRPSAAFFGLVLVLAGCGSESDSGTGPSCAVSAVSVAPAQLALTVGQSATLDASITSTNCTTPPTVTWTSSSAAVSVSANGTSAQVSGVSPTGNPVAVTATVDGISGASQVSVTAPLPTTIVFTAGSGSSRELWRMDPDGSNKIQLTSNGFGDYSPTLSPDGSQIGFVRDGSLYKMNANGSGAAFVASANGEVFTPAWSPNGSQFVFADFSGGFFDGKADLTIVTTAGTFVRTLLAQGRYNVEPTWSPDGAAVALADGDSPLGCCDVVRIPATGGATSLVFNGTGFAGTPAWSPDGTRIAFHSGFEIYVVSATGGTPVPLTPGADGTHPSWSPDGTRIVYEGIPSGGTLADIWVMNADGSNKVNLTNTPNIDEFQPTWGLKVGAPGQQPVIATARSYEQAAGQGPRSVSTDRRTRIVVGARRDAEALRPH